MTLATYQELLDALADWSNRDDLGPRLASFVALCESKLNRTLRVARMESVATLAVPAGAAQVALPDDCLELRSVRLAQPVDLPLRQGSIEWPPAAAALPSAFAVIGGALRLLPAAAQAASLQLVYYAALPPLEIAGSNWLLTRHPDVYLYGALSEAQGYVLDEARLVLWQSLYEAALDQVGAEDRHARWSGSSLAPLPAGP